MAVQGYSVLVAFSVERQLPVHVVIRRPRHCANGSRKLQKLATLLELADVNLIGRDNGAEMNLVYDRDTTARLGIDVQAANSLVK